MQLAVCNPRVPCAVPIAVSCLRFAPRSPVCGSHRIHRKVPFAVCTPRVPFAVRTAGSRLKFATRVPSSICPPGESRPWPALASHGRPRLVLASRGWTWQATAGLLFWGRTANRTSGVQTASRILGVMQDCRLRSATQESRLRSAPGTLSAVRRSVAKRSLVSQTLLYPFLY